MSNTLNVPAHIIKRIEERKKQENKTPSFVDSILGSGVNIPRISIRASRFRLVDNDVETVIGTELDVVIVGGNPNTSKMYFDKEYDPDVDMRPACSSSDGKKPDDHIVEPVSENCATCPMNEIGSKITRQDKKTKACADHRYLAVVAAADPKKVYAISVPVSGMTNMREYFKYISNFGVEVNEVITTLGFDDKESYPKLTFTHKAFVPEKVLPKLEALMESDEVKIAVRTMKHPDQPKLEAPAEKPAPAKKQEKLEVIASVEDDDTPKPAAKKTASKKAAPKPEPVTELEDASPDVTSEEMSDLESELDDLFA